HCGLDREARDRADARSSTAGGDGRGRGRVWPPRRGRGATPVHVGGDSVVTVTQASQPLTAEQLGTVHLIGVGGVGMAGLARLLLTRGIPVTGSELRQWPALASLRALGGTIHMDHRPSNPDGADTVGYSTALPADHAEAVR